MPQKLRPVLDYLEALTGRANLEVLQGLLTSSEVQVSDLKTWCRFSDDHYERNKVASGEWFDFYVMCWKPGQSSAIHDHRESSCAFRILKGAATEIGYKLVSDVDRTAAPSGSRKYELGEICSAQDGEIHKILNESGTDELITLHIYSPPLKMSVYEEIQNASGEGKQDQTPHSPF